MPVASRSSAVVTILAAAVLVSSTQALHAQVCTGNLSFAAQPMRIGVATAKRAPTTDYEADFSMGAAKGLFADAIYIHPSIDTPDGVTDSPNTGELAVGYDVAVSKDSPFHVCPIATIGYDKSDATFPGGSQSSHTTSYQIGGAAGWSTAVNNQVTLIPSAGFQYISNHFTTDAAGIGSSSGTVNGTALNLALGVVINGRVTVAPTLSLNFVNSTSFGVAGLSAAINFGR